MDFLNELGKKLASRSERGREDSDANRLTAQLRDAREELEGLLADLGRAYYESVAGTSQDVPPELVDRVREAMERIERLTARREREVQRVRCPSCGAMQPESARFFYIGMGGIAANKEIKKFNAQVPPVLDAPDAPEAEYCAHCGAMRQGGERYCALCGAEFSPEDAASSDGVAPLAAVPRAPAEPPEEPQEDRETWR